MRIKFTPLTLLLLSILAFLAGLMISGLAHLMLLPLFFTAVVMFSKKDLWFIILGYSLSAMIILGFNPVGLLIHLSTYPVLGLIAGVLYLQRASTFQVIMSFTLYYYIKTYLTLELLGGVNQNLFKQMLLALEQSRLPVESLQSMSQQELLSLLKTSFAGVTFFLSLLVGIMMYLLLRLLTRNLSQAFKPLYTFRVEGFSFGGFFLSLIALYLITGLSDYASTWRATVLLMVYLVFLFNGFATLTAFVLAKSKSVILSYSLGVIALLAIPLGPGLSLLGFMDAGLKLRKQV